MSTEQTLAHHLKAFSEGEGIDAIMEDYTEESVLLSPDGPIEGLADIRSFFESFMEEAPPELLDALEIVRQDIHGPYAYLVWKADPFVPLATDTFVIRDGTIVMQSFLSVEP